MCLCYSPITLPECLAVGTCTKYVQSFCSFCCHIMLHVGVESCFKAKSQLRAQVKLWTVASGACYVTLAEHAAPVTGVAFLPSASALVSASLDGTLRAWDLVRYRCFRTMTTPAPVQFASLAVDPSGEVRPRVPELFLRVLPIWAWTLPRRCGPGFLRFCWESSPIGRGSFRGGVAQGS